MTDLASPYFWLAVVVVGLLINIVSQLMMNASIKALGKVSKTWAARSERRWKGLRDFAYRLSLEPEYLQHIQWLERTKSSQRLIALLYAAVMLATGVFPINLAEKEAVGSFVRYLLKTVSLAIVVFSGWCMYEMMRVAGQMYHLQAAIKLSEEFRQVLSQKQKDTAEASAISLESLG